MSHFNAVEFEAILEVVKANNGVIGDDHGTDRTLKVAGIAILRKADEERGIVVPLIETKVGFCLNHMYLQDGQVRVSRNSVGGVIENGKHATLQAAVEAFNADQVDNQWTMGSLERIVYLGAEEARVELVSEGLEPASEADADNFRAVLAAARRDNGDILDEHTNCNKRLQQVGLATLHKPNGKLIPISLIRDDYFSVNEVVLNDKGEAVLSRNSVGGVVFTPKGTTLEEAIAKYNKDDLEGKWRCGQITNVTMF